MFQRSHRTSFARCLAATGRVPHMASACMVWGGVAVMAASGNRPPGAQGT